MAGKVPGKPVASRAPRARKIAPGSAIQASPVLAPEPFTAETFTAAQPTSAVLAAAETLAAPVAAPEPVPVPAPTIETPAEAPAAPTPVSQAVAAPAPAVDEPAAPVAVQSQTVAPAPVPAAENKKDTAMDTIETTTAKTETMFADMNSRAKTAMEKSQKLAGEMGDFHKGNLEAVVESAKIYAKGVEAMGQEAAEFGRRSFEQATAALKSMAQVKTPAELMKLHADYVRASFDAAVAEGSKTTEAMIKLAGDVAQPMSSRFAVVAEKVKTAA